MRIPPAADRIVTPPSTSTSTSTATATATATKTTPSPFARLLHGLGREMDRGESTMRAAVASSAAGKDLSSADLIALQAGVYRYSEAVDLAAKLVDRATNGVKTVVQGQ